MRPDASGGPKRSFSLFVILMIFFVASASAETRIRCASGTTIQNSGLFDYILPLFEKKTGIKVDVIAVGTGAALEIGKRGDADVVFVHAKEQELKAVEGGYFVNRHDVMYNDFVVVGPRQDRLRVGLAGNAADAFRRISEGHAPFVSRGDGSGTHIKELSIWKKLGIRPRGQRWYFQAGQGMAKTLRIANEKGAYSLTDRSTWLAIKDRDNLDMKIVFEHDPVLHNQYGVMAVNPGKHAHVKYREAMEFVHWLISEEGQQTIASFKDGKGNALFVPDAGILFALVPEVNVFSQTAKFEFLAEYLTRKIGVKVRIMPVREYGLAIDELASRNVDGAFLGSLTAAIAIEKVGAVPVARLVNPDGSSTYHGHLFVRKDSGIAGVKDMKGKRMAFTDKATTAGYLYPLAYFRENGIKDIRKFLGEYYFAGSHDAAIYAVLDKKADIAAAKNTVYDSLEKANPRVGRELVIIGESADVPQIGLCAGKASDQMIINKVKDALLHMHEDPDGVMVLRKLDFLRFTESGVPDYKPVFDIAKKAGIRLKSFRYMQ